MTLSRLTARAVTVALTAVLAAAVALVVPSPAFAATGTMVRQPAPAGQTYYGVRLTVLYTNSAPTTYFRVEFDLPGDTTVIPFNSLGFTRTGNHWVGQYSSSTPQTAGVQYVTGFAILGSQNPTNCRVDGSPCAYSVLTDTDPPTVPSNVIAVRTTFPGVGTGVQLRWSASTDNFGVTGYEITVNGQPYATTTNLYYSVPHYANAATTYAVRARDAVGNHSVYGTYVLPAL